jgi:hypothetical protein
VSIFSLKQQETTLADLPTIAMGACVALAFLVALGYMLTELHILRAATLRPEEVPPGIYAGAFYIIGGLLIPLSKRWLWAVGAVINAWVIWQFFCVCGGRITAFFSTPGLLITTAQMLLEIGLLYLILAYGRGEQRDGSSEMELDAV